MAGGSGSLSALRLRLRSGMGESSWGQSSMGFAGVGGDGWEEGTVCDHI